MDTIELEMGRRSAQKDEFTAAEAPKGFEQDSFIDLFDFGANSFEATNKTAWRLCEWLSMLYHNQCADCLRDQVQVDWKPVTMRWPSKRVDNLHYRASSIARVALLAL